MNKLKILGLFTIIIPLTVNSSWNPFTGGNESNEAIAKPAIITQIKCTAKKYTKFVDDEIELIGDVGWADNGRHDETFIMFLSKQKNRIKIRTVLANEGEYIDAQKVIKVIDNNVETKNEDGEVIPKYEITANHWNITDYFIANGVESTINIAGNHNDSREKDNKLNSYILTHTQTISLDKSDSGYDEKEILIYSCEDK